MYFAARPSLTTIKWKSCSVRRRLTPHRQTARTILNRKKTGDTTLRMGPGTFSDDMKTEDRLEARVAAREAREAREARALQPVAKVCILHYLSGESLLNHPFFLTRNQACRYLRSQKLQMILRPLNLPLLYILLHIRLSQTSPKSK